MATSSSIVRNIPDMNAFTIAFWMRTHDTENPGTPVSYANMVGGKLQDNALVIQDYGAFELHINNKKLFIGVSVNDGRWHHVAITWDSSGGKWFFYKDGQEVKRLVFEFYVTERVSFEFFSIEILPCLWNQNGICQCSSLSLFYNLLMFIIILILCYHRATLSDNNDFYMHPVAANNN